MLVTGLLGQAGHDWAHAGGESQRAWMQAMQAEQAWLAGSIASDDDAHASVQIFEAGRGHSHGDGTDPLHGGVATDHAHAVVFLMPTGPIPDLGGMLAARYWPLHTRIPVSPSDGPDRPPRSV